jgi:predicted 2-oxoglutarate/Fe(II)-dependent dioxygenase YbiX
MDRDKMTSVYTLKKNIISKYRCEEMAAEMLAAADSEFDPREGYSHFGIEMRDVREAPHKLPHPEIVDAITIAYEHFIANYKMKYNTFELKRVFGNVMATGSENLAHDDDGDVYPDKPDVEEHYSCILMINSEYEGGELFFEHHGQEVKLEAGDLIMFRGNAENLHGVRKITSGSRVNYILFFRNYHRDQPINYEGALHPW